MKYLFWKLLCFLNGHRLSAVSKVGSIAKVYCGGCRTYYAVDLELRYYDKWNEFDDVRVTCLEFTEEAKENIEEKRDKAVDDIINENVTFKRAVELAFDAGRESREQ